MMAFPIVYSTIIYFSIIGPLNPITIITKPKTLLDHTDSSFKSSKAHSMLRGQTKGHGCSAGDQ